MSSTARDPRDEFRSRVTQPVSDSVPKINSELAVGEDLRFQRKWWRFEGAVWWTFAVILLLDVIGLLGRGPLAQASAVNDDRSLRVQYERIERFDTPSMLRVELGPAALKDGRLRLWVSESLVRDLGNQRIVPQPQTSEVDTGGLLYTFPAQRAPATIEFALQPGAPGLHALRLHVPGLSELHVGIFVMP